MKILLKLLIQKKYQKKKSVFLTFDDGYIDHWKYVFPYLKKKKITGNFYPPIQAIENKKVLHVNKIHFILEVEKNRKKILNHISKLVSIYKNKNERGMNIYKIKPYHRFGDKETGLIKALLQKYLPIKVREKITDDLFKSLLKCDESDFDFVSYFL